MPAPRSPVIELLASVLAAGWALAALACDSPRFAARPASLAAPDAALPTSPDSRRTGSAGAAELDLPAFSAADAAAERLAEDGQPSVAGSSLAGGRSEPALTPEPMGGAWVTCYGNWKPQSTPERDVTRLGLLCGPANGMRLVGGTASGEVTDLAVEQTFAARAGECFRIFAVAEPAISDLAIEVRDPKGLPVASDHNSDRFPIVNPDGPFCLFDAGAYTLRVHARKGRGKYALQLWRLP